MDKFIFFENLVLWVFVPPSVYLSVLVCCSVVKNDFKGFFTTGDAKVHRGDIISALEH
jgi:hypothetical protein